MPLKYRLCAALTAGAIAAGCHRATVEQQTGDARPSQTSAETGESLQPAAAHVASDSKPQQLVFAEPPQDALSSEQPIQETWDAIIMQGTRVGYMQTTIAHVQDNGRDLVRSSSFVRVVLAREGQTSEQTMSFTSWDTSEGELVRFKSRMQTGPSEIAVSGTVRDGQLRLAAEQGRAGQSQPRAIPWSKEWGGPFAVERSLREQPLKAGEERTIHCLLQVLNVPGDIRLQALGEESVDLPGGARQLLKVRSITQAGQHQIEELRWLDERGDCLKSLVPSLGQEAIRTTKAEALRPAAATKPLDVMAASAIPIAGNRVPTAATRRAVYRARVKSGRVSGLFADGASQHVKAIDDQTADLIVVAVRPNNGGDGAVGATGPVEGDSQPNSFIQSDDRLIAQIAAQVAPRDSDAWKTACALESFVQGAVKNKNYSQAFATAADVARTLEGDCTEHSLLFAALCRARKIPARAALGLIYYPPKHGFAYHMWNEVWIVDRWIPMDSTLGLGGIGADHIKLGDSNFAGASPMADLLTVAQAFGRLEIDVLETE
jgi:transglutaminase superfamily protein